MLEAALTWLEQFYAPRWGLPAPAVTAPPASGDPGHGQAGRGELNLSSDIDLIFAFAEKGETQGGRKSLEHQEYFTKLGQS